MSDKASPSKELHLGLPLGTLCCTLQFPLSPKGSLFPSGMASGQFLYFTNHDSRGGEVPPSALPGSCELIKLISELHYNLVIIIMMIMQLTDSFLLLHSPPPLWRGCLRERLCAVPRLWGRGQRPLALPRHSAAHRPHFCPVCVCPTRAWMGRDLEASSAEVEGERN